MNRQITKKSTAQSERIIPDRLTIDPNKKVKVIALGGLCEIGKNTWAFECDDQILIVDAGLAFPSEDMHGVDLVLPDLTYLTENQHKIVALVITHGHEDHIGGVSNLLNKAHIPIIFAPPLAVGLLEVKLKEAGLLASTNMKRFKARETLHLGPFIVTLTRNNHSIPDSFCVIIQTPAGVIVHTGDFKFDHTPVDGELFDIAPLAEVASEGVLLMISDSTNAERAGYTPSEKFVYPQLEECFMRASKRIIITTFASQVHRIKQILEIANKYGRKVAILGRSMLNIALVSRQLGYTTFPDGLLVRAEEVSQLPPNKVAILTTGSQGEPLSALTRIANGSHKQISISPGDTVIISATPIPGNERSVASTVNALFSRGAQVVYGREAGVHVSGHCSQEEQRIMLNLIQPKYFMPAHGEYRMLVRHGKLGEEVCNMPSENVFIMENGDVLELTANSAKVVGEVPAGILMIDSSARRDFIKEETIKIRHRLSKQGFVSIIITAEGEKIISGPDVFFKGMAINTAILAELQVEIVAQILELWPTLAKLSEEELQAKIEALVLELMNTHKHSPIVQTVLMQMNVTEAVEAAAPV